MLPSVGKLQLPTGGVNPNLFGGGANNGGADLEARSAGGAQRKGLGKVRPPQFGCMACPGKFLKFCMQVYILVLLGIVYLGQQLLSG